MEELAAELNGKTKDLFSSYAMALENRLDYVYYNLNIKILNFGIKIGMELQQSFAETDNND